MYSCIPILFSRASVIMLWISLSYLLFGGTRKKRILGEKKVPCRVCRESITASLKFLESKTDHRVYTFSWRKVFAIVDSESRSASDDSSDEIPISLMEPFG